MGSTSFGLDQFFCSRDRRSKQGLEVSLLGVVGTESRRTTVLDVTQTPAGLSVPATKAATSYTRMNFYLEQATDVLGRLRRHSQTPDITHWVGDGNYARRKIFDGLEAEVLPDHTAPFGCSAAPALCRTAASRSGTKAPVRRADPIRSSRIGRASREPRFAAGSGRRPSGQTGR